MSYIEPNNPVNGIYLIIAVVKCATRSLMPDTLVVRRPRRSGRRSSSTVPRRESDAESIVSGRSSRSRHAPTSLPASAAPSANASVNMSAVSSQLPPTVPGGSSRPPRSASGGRSRHRSSSGGSANRSGHRSRSDSGDRKSHRSREKDKDGDDKSSRGRSRSNHSDGSDGRVRSSSDRRSSSRLSNTSQQSVRSERHRHKSSSSSERRGWFRVNWWKVLSVASHVVRTAPVAALHFLCVAQTDILLLPMLRFRDTSQTGSQLMLDDQSVTSDMKVLVPILVTRVALALLGKYITEDLCFENTLVVRWLRSRHPVRNLYGWLFKLGSHAVVDPFMYSIIAPIIMTTASSGTGGGVRGLRFSAAGAFKGLCLATAGSILRHYVSPVASHLFARGIVSLFDNLEYVIMRRYTTPRSRTGDDATVLDDVVSISSRARSDRGGFLSSRFNTSGASVVSTTSADTKAKDPRATFGSRGRVTTAAGIAAAKKSLSDAANKAVNTTSASHATNVTMDGEERTEAEEQEREQREARRAILRAIFYRITASIIAQCVVEHPLRLLSSMIDGRAFLHYTGLLVSYDALQGPTFPQTLAGCANQIAASLTYTRPGARTDSQLESPQAVLVLRGFGEFVADEVSVMGNSIVDVSGQGPAIAALEQVAREERLRGDTVGGEESLRLLKLRLLSLLPLLTAVHFTTIDTLLGFYLAVWLRLTQ